MWPFNLISQGLSWGGKNIQFISKNLKMGFNGNINGILTKRETKGSNCINIHSGSQYTSQVNCAKQSKRLTVNVNISIWLISTNMYHAQNGKIDQVTLQDCIFLRQKCLYSISDGRWGPPVILGFQNGLESSIQSPPPFIPWPKGLNHCPIDQSDCQNDK